MKNLILLTAVLLSFTACTMHDGYIIKGTIAGDSELLESGKIYLENVDRNNPIKDTADIVNGKFLFEGKVSTPEQYVITIDGINGAVEVFVENEKYVVKGDDSDLTLSEVVGGATQQLIKQLKDKYFELELKYDIEKIKVEYGSPSVTAERKEEIMKLYNAFIAEVDAFENDIISNNPLSHFTLHSLYRKLDDMELTKAKEKLNIFKNDVNFAANRIVAEIENKIAILEPLQIGEIAPDFTSKSPNGTSIALSDVYKKNKITMIDFWAGWCPPCRQFNPELVRIYKQFRGRGFQILGVSMDRERATWLKAIKDDKLTWPQVSDVKGWDTESVRLYDVRSIPQNVFVDKDGKIIARKLPKDKIVDFLKENL